MKVTTREAKEEKKTVKPKYRESEKKDRTKETDTKTKTSV